MIIVNVQPLKFELYFLIPLRQNTHSQQKTNMVVITLNNLSKT